MFANGSALIMLLPMAFCALLVYAAIRVVRAFRKAKSENASGTLKYYVFALICVAVSLPSWVFTMGWIRIILIWTGIPAMHCAVFLLSTLKAAERVQNDRSAVPLILLSGITYFLPYWILPDGGDVGGAYLFMGLVTDEAVIGVFSFVAASVAACNIALLILMLIIANKKQNRGNV